MSCKRGVWSSVPKHVDEAGRQKPSRRSTDYDGRSEAVSLALA